MPGFRVRAAAGCLLAVLLAGPVGGALGPSDRCQVKKLRVVAKMVRALFSCHVDAARRGTPVDPSCASRLRETTLRRFARYESASACGTVGDASTLADDLERMLTLLRFFDLGYPPGPSRCTAARLAALGRFGPDLLAVYARQRRDPDPDRERAGVTAAFDRAYQAIAASFVLDDCLAQDRAYDAVIPVGDFASVTVLGRLWPHCGDGVRAGTEQCDSTDGPACRCNPDCTCAHCGDGRVNAAGEQCDGPEDSFACAGLCQSDCRCPPPVCGNGIIEAGETCEATNDVACPGQCGPGCVCTPSVCGNGIVEVGEECDGTNAPPRCPPFGDWGSCEPPGTVAECRCCLAAGAECFFGNELCCEGSCRVVSGSLLRCLP